jgi:hypothetical protein
LSVSAAASRVAIVSASSSGSSPVSAMVSLAAVSSAATASGSVSVRSNDSPSASFAVEKKDETASATSGWPSSAHLLVVIVDSALSISSVMSSR